MPITSGAIEYERRLNLGEYNYKNVVAKILWTVEPGEDDDVLAAFAIDKVVMRVKDVLNWEPAIAPDISFVVEAPVVVPNIENKAALNLAAQHAVAEITVDNFSIAPGAHPPEHNTVGIPPALKRHRRTKAEMDAARAAAADDPDIKSNRHGEPADPLAPPENLSNSTSSFTANTSEPGMPSFDPDPKPPAEVTDQALLDACQAKASSGKPVADIKELVAKFSPGGLVQTPKDARQRFLDELAKL